MIKLYGETQSRAIRCLWMLEELGLEYEQHPVGFSGGAQQPDFLAINPNGRIPALDDDGLVLWESMAINLHLADKYDGGLRPRSQADRAHTLQWSFWGMTEIEPGLVDAFLHRSSDFLPEYERDPAVADSGEEKLQRPLAVLEAHLADRPWLLGDSFGVADLNVCSVLALVALAQVDLAKYANVQRWMGACLARPAARKAFGGR